MARHDRQVLPCIGGLCIGEPSGCNGELTGVIVVNFSGLLANSARRRRIASKSSAMRVMMESFLPDVGGAVAPRFRAGVFGTAAAQAADSAGSKRQPQRAIRTFGAVLTGRVDLRRRTTSKTTGPFLTLIDVEKRHG